MGSKLKVINSSSDWEREWEERAKNANSAYPLKTLKTLPKMEGIAKKTRKHLRFKAFWYLLKHDSDRLFFRYFLRYPKYIFSLITSYFRKKSHREGDFFLYGLSSTQAFEKKLQDPNRLFVLGFSYCHKPFECPSGRFTDQCIHDPSHLVCSQCFIGKCCNLIQKQNTQIYLIPTVHYIGKKMLELAHEHPKKQPLFLITACELSLEMFKDFGNMMKLEGVGVRLDGRICNTMKAFELSEKGIKPNLTVVLDSTQEKMIRLLKIRNRAILSK